jgi:hypothetical protein
VLDAGERDNDDDLRSSRQATSSRTTDINDGQQDHDGEAADFPPWDEGSEFLFDVRVDGRYFERSTDEEWPDEFAGRGEDGPFRLCSRSGLTRRSMQVTKTPACCDGVRN